VSLKILVSFISPIKISLQLSVLSIQFREKVKRNNPL
jgi:hypothetical protein